MSEQILNNLNLILQRIENACIKSDRNPNEVRLLLATKTVTAERIKIALLTGQTLIAENKIQEIKEKYEALKEIQHVNHFIGHLQTNKIKDILKYVNLVKQIAKFESIKIKGLMTIGLFSAETEKVRKCFKLLKDIQQKISFLNIPNVEMKELSMGMSGDLETAIEEGATIVRVGTAIFGERIYPDSYYWDENKSNI